MADFFGFREMGDSVDVGDGIVVAEAEKRGKVLLVEFADAFNDVVGRLKSASRVMSQEIS